MPKPHLTEEEVREALAALTANVSERAVSADEIAAAVSKVGRYFKPAVRQRGADRQPTVALEDSEDLNAEQEWNDSGVDWLALTAAALTLMRALQYRWRQPYYSLPSDLSARTAFTTTAGDNAVLSPLASRPVRGTDGVKCRFVESTGITPRSLARAAYDVVWAFERPLNPVDQALRDASETMDRALVASPELIRRVLVVRFGNHPSFRQEEEIDAVGVGSASLAIRELIGERLAKYASNVSDLGTIEFDEGDAASVISLLRAQLLRRRNAFGVYALLNAPVFDLPQPFVIGHASWRGIPVRLSLTYPDDATCTEVLRATGFQPEYIDEPLAINCAVQAEYTLPTEITLSDEGTLALVTGSLLRQVVDLMRCTFAGDLGILHLAGVALTEGPIAPIFRTTFAADAVGDSPFRRAFKTSTLGLFGAADGERLQRLSDRALYGKSKRTLGMPVALQRLRATYERHAAGDAGRIIDAVTGLESLLITDGGTQELKYRLCSRIALTLGVTPEEKLELWDKASDVYDARSGLVHGGTVPEALAGHETDLADGAVDLLRRTTYQLLLSDFAFDQPQKQMKAKWRRLALGEPFPVAT